MRENKHRVDYVNEINEVVDFAVVIKRLSLALNCIIVLLLGFYLKAFITGSSLLLQTLIILPLIVAAAFLNGLHKEMYGNIYEIAMEMQENKVILESERIDELLLSGEEVRDIVDEQERDRIDFALKYYGMEGLDIEFTEDSLLKYSNPLEESSLKRYLSLHKQRVKRLVTDALLNLGMVVLSSLMFAAAVVFHSLGNYTASPILITVYLAILAFIIQRLTIFNSIVKSIKRKAMNYLIVEKYLSKLNIVDITN